MTLARTQIPLSDPDMTAVGDENEIRDQLSAAMRELKETSTETAGGGAAPAPVEPSAEAPAERPEDAGRPRGPDGKFLPKAGEPEAKTETKPVVDKAQADKTPEKGSGEAQTPQAPGVPNTLPDPDKLAFQKLTPDAQALVSRREQHWNQVMAGKGREIAELTQHKQRYGRIDEVLAPYRPQMAKMGLTEDQALRQLFGLRDFAIQNPREFLVDWAKQHNIDLASLVPKPAGEDEYVDPQIKKVVDRLSTIEQQTTQAQQRLQQEERQRQEAMEAEVVSAIQQFRTATDEQGNLKYPHAQKLWDLMEPIAERIRKAHPEASHAAVMHVAYQRAERVHPETYALLQEKARQEWEAAQTKKQLEQAQEQERKRHAHVKEATRAAGSVTGSPGPGGAAPPQGTDSVEDDVRASYRAALAGRA